MPVEIRELIIRTQLGAPENENQVLKTSKQEAAPVQVLSNDEIIKHLNDLIKQQKER